MATLLCDHHLGFMPEFSDLTVIGKWTGNVDDPVGMKITVDVDGVPKAKLPLISVAGSSNIQLVRYGLRLADDTVGRGNESWNATPQPMEKIFGFSVDTFDGEETHYTLAKVTAAESIAHPPVDEAPYPISQGLLSPPSGSSSNDTVIRHIDEEIQQNPRKRSASEASLANSEYEGECGTKASRQEGPQSQQTTSDMLCPSSAGTPTEKGSPEELEAGDSAKPLVTEDLPEWLDPAERPAESLSTPVKANLREAFLGEIIHIEPKPKPKGINQPSFDLVGGQLFLDCPSNSVAAKWRITITLLITLQKGHPDGWYNLIVPGLPKFKEDDRGIFLFQVPESKAIEFRTTHLQDYTIIEDSALFAHFHNPESLVVPMRVCHTYPRLRDFTVDQQIKGDHAFKKVGNDVIWTIQYHALCSLRLHNHCFLAKYCLFRLYLDGGPECVYRCSIDSDDTGIPNLTLETGDKGIGRSVFEIRCAPRVLGKFCLSWEVNSTDLTGGLWLPRVYSSSALGDSRDLLRDGLGCEETRYVEDEGGTSKRKTQKKWRGRRKNKKLDSQDAYRYAAFSNTLCPIIIIILLLILIAQRPHWAPDPPLKCPFEVPSDFGNVTKLVMEENVAPSRVAPPTKRQELNWRSPGLSLIDRFDYFLGWRPPYGDYHRDYQL